MRKILVVAQFSFSIILIVLTIVSIKQLDFNFKVDLGFDRSRIIAVEIAGEAGKNLEVLKKELKKDKDIISVTASTALPVSWETTRRVYPGAANENEFLNMNAYGIDYDFIEVFDLHLLQGRSFSPLCQILFFRQIIRSANEG